MLFQYVVRSTFRFFRLFYSFFFILLSDKDLSIASIRSFAQPLRLCTRVLQWVDSVEFSITDSLFRSFCFRRPSSRSLVPSWSSPVVPRALAEVPSNLFRRLLCFPYSQDSVPDRFCLWSALQLDSCTFGVSRTPSVGRFRGWFNPFSFLLSHESD